MRFHCGAIPENPDFHPEAEGWSRIREPGPWAIQLFAVPVGIGLLLIGYLLLYWIFPHEILFSGDSGITFPEIHIGVLLAILILLAPVHELLHAVFQPGWGLSAGSIIGVWPAKGLFYAYYEAEMSRNRFLLVFIGPYLGLCLLPIALIAGLRWIGGSPSTLMTLALISILGGVLSSGDAIGLALALWQIPADALVRNHGWRTYWRIPGDQPPTPPIP